MSLRSASLALVLAAGLCTTPAAFAQVAADAPVVREAPPLADTARIEVVFVLDTTGSMSGLIEGAKAKIWSIANHIATAKPRPEIRMGLIGYRDRGDAYVTTLTSLTDDLDAIYADLMKFKAEGGGDEPESVNQALHEAVTKFDWADDKNTLKLIYLVGDAPPHMDYEQDVVYQTSCKLAATAGITINTIQCGGSVSTTPIWQEIARGAEGEFFQIDQSGGMTAIATPFDEDLNRLGIELETTLIAYGGERERMAQTAKMEMSEGLALAAAPAEAKAARVAFKASEAGMACLTGQYDLVQACKDGSVDITKLPDDQLPEHMRAMSVEQRVAFVDRQTKARENCQARINEISAKRADFIKDELAKTGAHKDSFDAKVLDALCRQAARLGIHFADSR